MIDGEMDAGAWSCGMVVGLITDIPTVKKLIGRSGGSTHRLAFENHHQSDIAV